MYSAKIVPIDELLPDPANARLIISYADCDQEHHGGIYAAGGWVYVGRVEQDGGTPKWKVRGRVTHGRTVGARYGYGSQRIAWLRQNVDPYAEKVWTKGKQKYLMPLDTAIKTQVDPLRQAYPKRAGSDTSDTLVLPDRRGR